VLDAALGGYEMMLPPAFQTYPDQAYDGPFYRLRSPIRNIARVQVPTFIVGGTYDLFQRGEPILFNGLMLSASQKKLMIGPWYHTTAGNGLTADDGTNPVYDSKGNLLPSLNNLQLAWFDHWLKGIGNGIDTFPAVETYYLGAGKWAPDTRYPASRTTYRYWYLSAASGSGAALYAGSLAPAVDRGATTVTDVDPSGASSQITAGTLVASLRALTTTPCRSIVADCSVYAKGHVIEPWHPYTRASQVALTPGVPTPLEIEIFPTSAVIEPGHSLRLTITTGDFPHETPTSSTVVDSAGGIDTLYIGPDHPSSIYLGTVSPAPVS